MIRALAVGTLIAAMLPTAGIAATKSAATKSAAPKTYVGESKPVGNGTVRTWVTVDAKGAPSAVGVTFSETTLLGLPMTLPKDDIGWEWNLALPTEAKVAPFDHVAFYWNPKGHIPDGIYNVSHFDIHFFMVPEPTRAAKALNSSPSLRSAS